MLQLGLAFCCRWSKPQSDGWSFFERCLLASRVCHSTWTSFLSRYAPEGHLGYKPHG